MFVVVREFGFYKCIIYDGIIPPHSFPCSFALHYNNNELIIFMAHNNNKNDIKFKRK